MKLIVAIRILLALAASLLIVNFSHAQGSAAPKEDNWAARDFRLSIGRS